MEDLRRAKYVKWMWTSPPGRDYNFKSWTCGSISWRKKKDTIGLASIIIFLSFSFRHISLHKEHHNSIIQTENRSTYLHAQKTFYLA